MGETGGTRSESDPHRAVLEDVAAVHKGAAAVRRERPVIPAHVDPSTGNRYYEPGQANRAEAVRILRSVDTPLEEIRAFLETENPDLARKQLVVRRERLALQERMLAYLESLMKRKGEIVPYDVEVAETKPQLVAAIKMRTNPTKIANDIGTGFGSLMHAIGREGVATSIAPLIVYHDVIDKETEGDIEICVPIGGSFTGDSEVYSHKLEGGTVATTVHHGPYEEIAPAYHALTGWGIREWPRDDRAAPRGVSQRPSRGRPGGTAHQSRVSDLI